MPPIASQHRRNVLVIGSGPAAWAVLQELLPNYKGRVTLLESGPAAFDLDDPNEITNPNLIGRKYRLKPTTCAGLGGASNLWHGILAPLDPIDFEKRDYIPHSGWPISYQDLLPWYQKIAQNRGWDAHLFDQSHHPQLFIDRAKDIELGELLRNKYFLQPQQIFRTASAIKALAQHYLNFEILTNHHCLSLELEWVEGEKEGLVRAVNIGLTDGRRKRLEAQTVILCCGALQSPRILLNSAPEWQKKWPKTFQNVGRYLLDHPMGNVFQVRYGKKVTNPLYIGIPYRKGQLIKSALRLSEEVQRQYGLPNSSFYLRPSFSIGLDDLTEQTRLALLTVSAGIRKGYIPWKEAVGILKRPGLVAQIVQYLLRLNLRHKFADAYFITEQVPNQNSRVVLSHRHDRWGFAQTDVDWQLSQYDYKALHKSFDLISSQFQLTHKKEDVMWDLKISSAAHHLGTCRMADHPDQGVVDSNGKVFGMKGVYVADGSVFPTGGNANSTYTIMALAARCASLIHEGWITK